MDSTLSRPVFIYSSCAVLLLLLLLRPRRSRSPGLPPGPKPWPIVGNLPHLGAAPHQTLARLARRYGSVMYLRLGCVDAVVASSAKAAAQFLRAQDANFCGRPPISGAKYLTYGNQDMVFAPYGPRWRLFRKLSAVHLFSAKTLDDCRHVREEEAAQLTRTLWSAGQSPVRIGHLLNLCIVNALGRAMLGKRVFVEQRKADEFKEMVVEIMAVLGVFNIGDFIPALGWFDLQGVMSMMKSLRARFDAFVTVVLENHRSQIGGDGPRQTDFLSALLQADIDDADGGKLRDTEIKGLLLNMFTAGTDTSSSTVEWAMAELIRHPNIMAQAQREVDAVVGLGRLVSESDLPRLTFLQAVVKETLRLHPSTPLSLPRMAAESCEVDGYRVPKGATLLVNVWAIARDPDTWTEPLEFRPERFLLGGERPEADVKGNDFEVIPFGAGRRICAGMSLGLRMVQLLTATLVQAFEWELPAGQEAETMNMEEVYGLTLQRAEPLTVHVRPRLWPQVYERGLTR